MSNAHNTYRNSEVRKRKGGCEELREWGIPIWGNEGIKEHKQGRNCEQRRRHIEGKTVVLRISFYFAFHLSRFMLFVIYFFFLFSSFTQLISEQWANLKTWLWCYIHSSLKSIPTVSGTGYLITTTPL